jgi:hypothetical protein
MLLLLLLLLGLRGALPARVPGSPFPLPRFGLNCSQRLLHVLYADIAATPSDQLTLQALQGVVNRDVQPQLLARVTRGGAAEFWLNATRDTWGTTLSYDLAALPTLAALVAAFRPALTRGYILCSLTDGSATVAAAAAAALGHALVVTPQNEALATAAGLQLALDVRGRSTAWAVAALNGTALSQNFTFSRTVTTLQSPTAGLGCMTDYSIASGALQWWVEDAASAQAGAIFASMAPPFTVLGWGPDELGTVSAASHWGGGVSASDWASNLDVLSSFDLPALVQRRSAAARAPPAAPTATHTVCFLMSDGDNLQWLLDGFATDERWWGSPARGTVPLGWTLSAAAADLAPVLPSLLYSTASDSDVFVAGVSGAAYFYPDLVQGSSHLDALTALGAGFMAKAGLRILNVLARGDAVAQGAAESLLQHSQVDALLWYPFSDYSGLRGSISWSSSGKPIIGGRFNLW